MDARKACLRCLDQGMDALFQAALWIAAEHDPTLRPERALTLLERLRQRIALNLPDLPDNERAQPLLRLLGALDFQEDSRGPDRVLLHRVLQQRRGQPLALGLLALELAHQLDIPLRGINFPGRFLLRVPGADHLLDPATGRRLYLRDCRELLDRRYHGQVQLTSGHLQPCSPTELLQRLSRSLRHQHLKAGQLLAALKDADRVLQLGTPTVADHLARADLYQRLECPPGERFDLQHALLLSEDPGERLRLTQRLFESAPPAVMH